MGKKKVSLQTIADELGISKYSVSLALNNKPGVSDELREKIFEMAQRLNYEKSKLKSANRNLNIVVIIPEYIRRDTYFYSVIYWAIENCIQSKGHTAILTSVGKDMEEKFILPAYFAEIEVAGILTVGVLSEDYIRKVQDTGLPLVSVDQYYDAINVDVVGSANEEGAYQMVEYLIKNGHKDIGFIGSIDMTSSIYSRWCGYQKAMSAYGLEVDRNHCILESSPLESLLGMRGAQSELEGYIEKMTSFPSAWFCASDGVGVNLLRILAKRGIRVPEEISVAGFDNQEITRECTPNLTTYDVKRTEMGRLAVERLLQKIESPLKSTYKISIHGDIVVRDSVCQYIGK